MAILVQPMGQINGSTTSLNAGIAYAKPLRLWSAALSLHIGQFPTIFFKHGAVAGRPAAAHDRVVIF
jgi:hypothetical protein